MTKNVNRKEIIKKAIHDCYAELYAKAQPLADYDNLVAERKAGKINEEDGPVYDRHYISKDELEYIVNKYIEAYGMTEHWKSDVETIEDYLINGGSKNAYVDSSTDDNGNYHPGYRSYEDVAPLKNQIHNILSNTLSGINLESSTKEVTSIVMETIKNCKDFYRFDREADEFKTAIYLGAAPTSNPDIVRKWWKDNYNVDIEIEERNPLLLWEQDNYGDAFEEIMEEEDGPNWKEIWKKKWEEKYNGKYNN